MQILQQIPNLTQYSEHPMLLAIIIAIALVFGMTIKYFGSYLSQKGKQDADTNPILNFRFKIMVSLLMISLISIIFVIRNNTTTSIGKSKQLEGTEGIPQLTNISTNRNETSAELPINQTTHLNTPDASPSISSELNIEINPNIPREWSDPTLGIEFVKAGDDNYWIGKDEITISQFSRYFSNTEIKNEDQDQSPDCINIGSLKKKQNIENDSHSVTCISWKEARDFAVWLTEKDKIGTFSIPTKKEWQRACEKGLINPSTSEWSADKFFLIRPMIPLTW